jgi:hypothetical protein
MSLRETWHIQEKAEIWKSENTHIGDTPNQERNLEEHFGATFMQEANRPKISTPQ